MTKIGLTAAEQEQNAPRERPVGGEIDGPGRHYFDNVVIDNMLDAMIELTAAVWTQRDRMMIMERVLQKLVSESGKEINLSKLIEDYVPSPEDQAARAAERNELVAGVFKSFARRPQ